MVDGNSGVGIMEVYLIKKQKEKNRNLKTKRIRAITIAR